MKYLGIIFSSIIIVLVPILFRYFQKKESSKQQGTNIIKQLKIFLYIGVMGCIFTDLLLPSICFLELDPSLTWYESLAFSSIAIVPLNFLYVYLLLMAINWKVIVEEDCVIYYNLFKKKKIFHFSEYTVKNFPSSIRVVKLYKNKKNKKQYKSYLIVSNYCPNSNLLFDKYKQYQLNHKKKS